MGGIEMLISSLFPVLAFIAYVWATIDCLKSTREGSERIGLILLIWLAPFGPLIYLIWRWWARKESQQTYATELHQPFSYQPRYGSEQQEQRGYSEGYQQQREWRGQEGANSVKAQPYEEPQAAYPEMPQSQEMRQRASE